MKTFFLFCQVFWGSTEPQFTPQELVFLDGCQKRYTQLVQCKVAETEANKVKQPGVTIITSCGLKG